MSLEIGSEKNEKEEKERQKDTKERSQTGSQGGAQQGGVQYSQIQITDCGLHNGQEDPNFKDKYRHYTFTEQTFSAHRLVLKMAEPSQIPPPPPKGKCVFYLLPI